MSNTKTSDEILAEALKQQETPTSQTSVSTPESEPIKELIKEPDPIPAPIPVQTPTPAPIAPKTNTFAVTEKKKTYGKYIS